jgi:Type II secretion system (T2SS), protein M subtype b
MIGSLSLRVSKFAALALLLFAAWSALTLAVKIASARLRLQSEIAELRRLHDEITRRRIDIPSLEAQLARLGSDAATQQTVIVADHERAALAQLQQATRKAVQEAGGQLLGLTEVSVARAATDSAVASQLRLRIGEAALPRLMSAIEQGSPRLRWQDFSIAARAQASEAPSELELTATVRGRWLPQKGAPQ